MCKCQRNHCLALQLNEFHRNSFASLGNIQRKQFQKICLEIKVLEKIEFACNCFFFLFCFFLPVRFGRLSSISSIIQLGLHKTVSLY